MKKVLIFTVAAALILSGCTKNNTVEYEDKEELSHIQFTDGEGNPGGKRIYKYYPGGLVADMSVNDSLGNSVLYESYTYSDDGNMLTKDIYSIDQHEAHTYTYKDKLLVTEEVVLTPSDSDVPDDVISHWFDRYTYSADGEKESIETVDDNDEVVKITRFIYDDEGRVKKERIFSGNESYLGGTEYTYEGDLEKPVLKEYVGQASEKYSKEELTYKDGLLTETVRYGKDGKVFETITVEYDSQNRKSIVTSYNADGEADAINNYFYENYISLIG